MIRAIKKAALSDCVGECEICHRLIIGDAGFTEFYEYIPNPELKYVECMHNSMPMGDISPDNNERKSGQDSSP